MKQSRFAITDLYGESVTPAGHTVLGCHESDLLDRKASFRAEGKEEEAAAVPTVYDTKYCIPYLESLPDQLSKVCIVYIIFLIMFSFYDLFTSYHLNTLRMYWIDLSVSTVSFVEARERSRRCLKCRNTAPCLGDMSTLDTFAALKALPIYRSATIN